MFLGWGALTRRPMQNRAVLRFAGKVSILFNPLVIGVPVMLLIGFKDVGGIPADQIPLIILCVGTLCVFPLVYVITLMRFGIIKDFHITDRKQRVYLFPVVLVCLTAVVVILYRTEGASELVLKMLAFGLVSCVVCALITVWFKISLHCVGLGWMSVGLYQAFGVEVFFLGLGGLCLAAWSRLVLREHTLTEVLAGAAFGVGVTWLEFAWFGSGPVW